MKKLLSMVLGIALSVATLTGCAGQELSAVEFVDGTYHVEFSDYDSLGWKDYVTVTVTDGDLTEVIYDSVNEEGELKSEDESYKAQMDAANVGTYPAKYNQDLINQFLEGKSVDSVDVVANATIATNSFKSLMAKAISNAYSGETATTTIEN